MSTHSMKSFQSLLMEHSMEETWQSSPILQTDAFWEKCADDLAKCISDDKGIQMGAHRDKSREIIPVVFPDGKIGAYISFNGEKEIPLLYLPEEAGRGAVLPDFETLPETIKRFRLRVKSIVTTEMSDNNGKKYLITSQYNGSIPVFSIPDEIAKKMPEVYPTRHQIKEILRIQREEILGYRSSS